MSSLFVLPKVTYTVDVYQAKMYVGRLRYDHVLFCSPVFVLLLENIAPILAVSTSPRRSFSARDASISDHRPSTEQKTGNFAHVLHLG